ncbi:MAG: hypothetical protein WD670_06675, partial [Actinomycetota bacterium]
GAQSWSSSRPRTAAGPWEDPLRDPRQPRPRTPYCDDDSSGRLAPEVRPCSAAFLFVTGEIGREEK